MTEIRNSNVLVIEYWNLEFICNLVLEIWDLTIGPKSIECFSVNSPCKYFDAAIFHNP